MRAAPVIDRILLRLARPKESQEPRQGVLLIAAGGLGDIVLLMPVLERFAALAAKGEQVTLLLRKDAAKMGFLAPPEIEILPIDFARLRGELLYRLDCFRLLASRRLRLAVSLDFLRHPLLDEALLLAAGAVETAAMTAKPWRKYQNLLDANAMRLSRHFDSGAARQDKLLRLAAFADWLLAKQSPPPVLALPEARLPPPDKAMQPTVFIQPFSAVKAKQSPPEFYLPLLDGLPKECKVALLGAPGDLERNPEFKKLLERPEVVFDARPFKELLPSLRAARLVVSVDTALMHLAALSGAPTLCLASAAYEGEIVPYPAETCPPNVRFLMADMTCKGCLGVCVHPDHEKIYPCVAKLKAGEAAAAAMELMEEFA